MAGCKKPVATLRRSQRMAGFEPVICTEASAIRVLVAAGQPVGRNRVGTSGSSFQLEPGRLVGRA